MFPNSSQEKGLKLEGLYQSYGKTLVIKDVNLFIREGEFITLLGPSGSGKTTLLMIIAGFVDPSQGRIELNGKEIIDLPPERRNFGLVFQGYALFPHMNVYRNIAFAAFDEEDVERLMKVFDIWPLRDQKPDRISGGERQRAAICQNLARRPRVLLLDEPFSALDGEIRRKLRHERKALKEQLSLPMIHVTHDLSEALFLGDEILSLVKGKIAQDWLEHQLREIAENGAWISKGWRKTSEDSVVSSRSRS